MASTIMARTRVPAPLEVGRNALARGDWRGARRAFERALEEAESGAAYEGLSWAALRLDDGDAAIRARKQAYRLYRQSGDDVAAARMAMWLGKDLEDFRGELAVARGWQRRARTLLEGKPPSAEHGWLPIFELWATLSAGEDPKAVQRGVREAVGAARACGAPDIEIVARAVEGQALVGEGRIEEGFAALDEAAAAVLGGELQEETWATAVFCCLIYACERVRDFGRAAQWCQRMRDVADRLCHAGTQGLCRAHYGAVLTCQGKWGEAEEALSEAAGYFEASWPPQEAEVTVRLGELRRRQGRVAEATELWRRVSWHPRAALGLAHVALAEGRLRDARELADRFSRHVPEGNRLERLAGLELVIRLCAASEDVKTATEALAELERLADEATTRPLYGALYSCKAVVAGASGEPERARAYFEDATAYFEQSGMPFESAQARLELARVLIACDRPGRARDEVSAARDALGQLDPGRAAGEGEMLLEERASAILAEIDGREAERGAGDPMSLTPRQTEILKLVSRGLSDREIAGELGVSEHTVHRHVANILLRLDAPTRAAAAARAAAKRLI